MSGVYAFSPAEQSSKLKHIVTRWLLNSCLYNNITIIFWQLVKHETLQFQNEVKYPNESQLVQQDGGFDLLGG